MGQKQTGPDILGIKVGILPEDGLGRVPRRQHSQDMLHRDPHVTDDRLAAEDIGANDDPIKQFGFSSHVFLQRFCLWGFVNPVGRNLPVSWACRSDGRDSPLGYRSLILIAMRAYSKQSAEVLALVPVDTNTRH